VIKVFGNYDSDKLIAQFTNRVNQKTKNSYKVVLYITLVFVLGLIAIYFLTDWFFTEDGVLLIIFFSFLIILALILVIVISKYYIRTKVVFEYLFKEIYQQINNDNDWVIEYLGNPKVKNDFVKEGGLFSKYCRATVLRSVKGITENKNPFVIYDLKLITGGGQYQQTHLDGLYFITKVSCNNVFQIRSNGKPSTKLYQFDKLEIDEDLKVFLKSGANIDLIERTFLSKMKEIKSRLKAKKIYLSMMDNNLHFAYSGKDIPRGKKISSNRINELYQIFIDEIRLIDELVGLTDF
jgi:hypothetical protein